MEKRSFQERMVLVTKIKKRSSHRLKKTEDQQTFKKSNFIRNVRGNTRQKGKIQ